MDKISMSHPISLRYQAKCVIKFLLIHFKKLLAQLGDQTDIFWKFYSPTDTLWLPKTVRQVLGYTAGDMKN